MRAIWAQSVDGVIGDGVDMPWHLPEDLAHFKEQTLGAPVVMGSATWRSLPARFRPLPGRDNYVLSRKEPGPWSTGATVLPTADNLPTGAWIMGGSQVYAATLPQVTVVLRTLIDAQLAPILGARAVYAPSLDEFVVTEETEWRTSTKGRFHHDADLPVRYKFQWLTHPTH